MIRCFSVVADKFSFFSVYDYTVNLFLIFIRFTFINTSGFGYGRHYLVQFQYLCNERRPGLLTEQISRNKDEKILFTALPVSRDVPGEDDDAQYFD